MDIFFEAAPVAKKRRVHFHEFMLARHAFLRDARAKGAGQDQLIAQAAKQVADEARLLCFDEVQVTDIADAPADQDDESLIEPGQMVVTITRDGFIKRTTLDRKSVV